MKLYPSLIEADLFHMPAIIEAIEPYIDGYHIDIMDYHFVPNISWGPLLVQAIGHIAKKPLWLHLMVTQPEKLLVQCLNQKNEYIVSVHQESISDWNFLKDLKKRYAITLGIAFNPYTSLEKVMNYSTEDIDHILIMTVNPGFSGQQLLPSSWDRIDQACLLRDRFNKRCAIAVDGGIKIQHIQQLEQKNVTMVAAASALFGNNRIMQHTNLIESNSSLTLQQYIEHCLLNIQEIKKIKPQKLKR